MLYLLAPSRQLQLYLLCQSHQHLLRGFLLLLPFPALAHLSPQLPPMQHLSTLHTPILQRQNGTHTEWDTHMEWGRHMERDTYGAGHIHRVRHTHGVGHIHGVGHAHGEGYTHGVEQTEWDTWGVGHIRSELSGLCACLRSCSANADKWQVCGRWATRRRAETRQRNYTNFGSIDFFHTWRCNGIVLKERLCKVWWLALCTFLSGTLVQKVACNDHLPTTRPSLNYQQNRAENS